MLSRAWLVRLTVLLSLTLCCAGIWWVLPNWRIWWATRAMARLEAESPTTDFQWPGAPVPSGKRWTVSEVANENAEITGQLELAEARLGVTADAASLRGRLAIRAKAYDEAVRQMDLARLLDDSGGDGSNRRRLVDLGLAYGVRGLAENRTFDVVQGLDKLLRARESSQFGTGEFEDLALLAEAIPAPRASVGFWTEALKRADGRDKVRLGRALAAQQEIIDARRRRMESVLGTRRASREIPGSTELLLQVALAEWIGDRDHHGEDLRALAAAFLDIHRDPVVRDLIGMPSSLEAERALMAAAAANRAGEYANAVEASSLARGLYAKLGNAAGEVLAANEWLYAWRVDKHSFNCTADWTETARSRGYVLASLRAQFEDNSCRSRGETEDVIAARQSLAAIAESSGYPAMAKRASSALVEPFHNNTSPSMSWSLGHRGITGFWRLASQPVTGLNFYAVLGNSTLSSAMERIGLLMIDECLAFESELPNPKIVVGYRSVRASLSKTLGLNAPAVTPPARAQAALDRGHPKEALEILDEITGGTAKFPYPQLDRPFVLGLMPVLSQSLWQLGRRNDALKHAEACRASSLPITASVQSPEQREATVREYSACWVTLVEEYLALGRGLDALDTWQEYRNLGRRSAWHRPTPLPGEAWISIAKLHSNLAVMLLDSRGWGVNVVRAEDVERLAGRFAALSASGDAPIKELNASGARLGDRLWGHLRNRVEGSGTAMIDAVGTLANVPWSALPRADGAPWVSTTATVQVVGWGDAVRNPVGSWSPALVVANPVFKEVGFVQFPILPGADDQVRAVMQSFPGSKAMVGSSATLRDVRHAMSSARVFHFFGHGVASGGSAGIVLSGDSGAPALLTAADVSRMDLSSLELAVLTACSSGLAQTPGLLNTESLSHALLLAGAGRVVASRWNVDSKSSANLMIAFYRNLSRGQTVAQSLRAAMDSERRSHPQPWFWAGNQAYGAR